MADRSFTALLDSLVFPECPRWHDGRLWFSDVHDRRVYAMTADGQPEVIAQSEDFVGGLGWLPDGRLLFVSMVERKLMRLDSDGAKVVADLSALAPFHCNDMVVDAHGRAYIGNFGFDIDAGAEPTSTSLICVEPDGEAWVVVEQLLFPNGMVITDGGATLVVAESFGQRLSAYAMNGDGSLTNPRVWADLRPNVPDGICVDAAGGIWVADPVNRGVMRVVEGAGPVDWIATGRPAYACALGGPDGQTLYVCTADSSDPARTSELRSGRIETTRVDVPAAGYGEAGSG
ncbi:MAG TPA: SMP-30/gluconolactonase/LRE family protein [Acidimicrobiales bacterium]